MKNGRTIDHVESRLAASIVSSNGGTVTSRETRTRGDHSGRSCEGDTVDGGQPASVPDSSASFIRRLLVVVDLENRARRPYRA